MDGYNESHAKVPMNAPTSTDMPGQLHANETISRLVAYMGPYILWASVALIGIGLVMLPG